MCVWFIVCCRLDCVGVAVYVCVRGQMCSCVLSVTYYAMLYDVLPGRFVVACACCLMCLDAVFVSYCAMMHAGLCVCCCVRVVV